MKDKKKEYFIYKYTFPNGKVYIGQTYKRSYRFGLESRYRGSLVYNAMKKYSDFKKEILEYCTKDEVDERERYYIRLFDSTNRSKGYNRDTGGSLHKEATDDLRKELSNKHLGTEFKAVLQLSPSGAFIKKWPSIKSASEALGINRSEISHCIHGKSSLCGGFLWKLKKPLEAPKSTSPILQFDLNGRFVREWANESEAEKALGIRDLYPCLSGHRYTKGGYQWKYKNCSKKIGVFHPKMANHVGKAVYQYDLQGKLVARFGKILEAAKATGIPYQHIERCLKGQRKASGGYQWRHEPLPSITEKYGKSFVRPVKQYDLQGAFLKEWPSISGASEALGIKYGIGSCCRLLGKTAGGYQWKYSNDPRTIAPFEKKTRTPFINWNQGKHYLMPSHSDITKVVQCRPDGSVIKVWDRASHAGKTLGISQAHISMCINGKRAQAGGFVWKKYKGSN
jgi:plasmid maintenance system antidote protein VapI